MNRPVIGFKVLGGRARHSLFETVMLRAELAQQGSAEAPRRGQQQSESHTRPPIPQEHNRQTKASLQIVDVEPILKDEHDTSQKPKANRRKQPIPLVNTSEQ